MAIVVEDGSIVSGANSFVTRAAYIAYAASIGTTIADDSDADVELIKAGEYINSLSPKMKGTLTDRDQPMSYPRDDLVLEGFDWENNEIPAQVIEAQKAVALEIHAGLDPYNPAQEQFVVGERVEGAVSVQYAEPNGVMKLPEHSRAQALIRSLLELVWPSITAVRV